MNLRCVMKRCEKLARKGTGTGMCNRPLDKHGNCDRASSHIQEDETLCSGLAHP